MLLEHHYSGYLYILGETYLFVQLLMSETRSEGRQVDLLASFKHHIYIYIH